MPVIRQNVLERYEGKSMEQPTVTVMLTCFNRKNATVSCVQSLVEGNPQVTFRFIITDDNSSDGTKEALEALPYDVTLLQGNGQLYWNGGMAKALALALEQEQKTDYYMLVNDDVSFYNGTIERLIKRQKEYPDCVMVGSTADSEGRTSYGGVKLLSKHFAKFAIVEPSGEYTECDTFNGNCVLLPSKVFHKAGNLDMVYRHSMSDYDYGMHIRKMGFVIYNSEEHVGQCNDNDVSGSWRDTTLSRRERLRRKESPKGLPRRDWYHFIRKNYGFLSALYHSVTPYIRILCGK